MTNPDNIVRVRARNGGRASVYEANGWCQAYGSGILDGTGVVQNTSANMTVLVGGSSSKPDVLIAENPSGYKIALDLVGEQPVTITAPASNSRISAIVAYTDDLALESTEDTVTGSPASCGLIVVNGSSSASPSAPTDTQIRNAITADGATGSQASYAVIATIRVASNTTSITNALITRNQAGVQSSKIDFATFSAITAKGSYGDSLASANSKIMLNTVYSSRGNKFTLINGEIRIGSGVNLVLVGASVFYVGDGATYGWFDIFKNNNPCEMRAIANTVSSSYDTATISPFVLRVSEGDIIRLQNLDDAKIRGTATHLTIIDIG